MENKYFAVFYGHAGGKWWTMIGQHYLPDYSAVLDRLKLFPKKIRLKRRKGSGEDARLECIKFTGKKFDYKIVNWGNVKPNYG